MVNPSKAKGTACETALTRWLHNNGYPTAERRALAGSVDKGDILLPGLPVVVEVKNTKTLNLGPHLQEALIEQANAKADYGILVQKRVGYTDPAKWFFVTTVAQGFQLLGRAL